MAVNAVRTILIVEAEQAANLSIVTEQMGYPQDFTDGRKVCALNPAATDKTPPTHFLAHDERMSSQNAENFALMSAGDYMPEVDWSNIPGITEQDAIAAAQALTVDSKSGPLSGLPSVEYTLAGMGLQLVPDPQDPW